MMKYRPMEPKDFEETIPLIFAFCEETGVTAGEREIMASNIRLGLTRVVIAENGKIHGAGGWIPTIDGRLGEFIYIKPESRKQGIGAGLLEALAGGEKFKMLATEDQSKMYLKRGWKVTHYLLEREG